MLPQAYFSGPAKVKIAYFMSPFVNFLELILCPFVTPITFVLDRLLGHHEDKIVLNKENLKNLLFLHNKK